MAERLQIGGRTLALGTAAVLVVEVAMAKMAAVAGYPLWVLGLTRLFQIVLLAAVLILLEGGAAPLGVDRVRLPVGLRSGAAWSAGFGAVVGTVGAALWLAGIDPLPYIRADLPSRPGDLFWLFAVGGVVGPLAEELFFRGFLFGYCRRWGFVPALLISTAAFALAHSGSGRVYPPHVISGLLLAAAYEREKSLVVPAVIHVTANLAIFSLSLPG